MEMDTIQILIVKIKQELKLTLLNISEMESPIILLPESV